MKNPKLVYEQNIKDLKSFLELLEKGLKRKCRIFLNFLFSVKRLITVSERFSRFTKKLLKELSKNIKSLNIKIVSKGLQNEIKNFPWNTLTKKIDLVSRDVVGAKAIIDRESQIVQKGKERRFIIEQAYVLAFSYFEVFLKDYFRHTINKYNILAKSFDAREYSISNLSQYDFNIKSHMGDLIVEKFNFSKLEDAWGAYDKLRIDFYKSGITKKRLNTISAKRCVLVHNLGIKDSNYFRRLKLRPGSKTKKRISIDKANVEKEMSDLSKIVNYIDVEMNKKIQRITSQSSGRGTKRKTTSKKTKKKRKIKKTPKRSRK